jgi:hypothetical protein
MKKYEVCVDFTMTRVYEVEADSPEDAEAQAIRIAVDEGQDTDLSITVGYVDEYEGDDDE